MNKVSILLFIFAGLLYVTASDWDTVYEYDGYDGDGYDCCDSDGNCCDNMNVGDAYWNRVRGKPFQHNGKTRHYYLASEEVEWDYAPEGHNVIFDRPFNEEEHIWTQTTNTLIGTKYIKCLYREYTSASYTTLKPRAEHEKHLGFMGPTIRAEVGDILKVTLYNKCRFPTTIHPHGVFYFKDGEGAIYSDGTSGRDKLDDGVETGKKFTYVWKVNERAGPGLMDGSSVMWMYHSHHDEFADFYAGLVGNMVVVAKGMMGKNGLAKDIDQEVFWMFSVSDEGASPYIEDNIRKYTLLGDVAASRADPQFNPSNLKFGINGYIFGNSPLVTLKKGTHVRWYIMSMGGFRDTHTPHWHGNVLMIKGMRMDVTAMSPAEMLVADMVPDDVGIWLHHCHVQEHFVDGMVTRYKVIDNK